MSPYLLAGGLFFLVQGVFRLVQPTAMLAFEGWIAARLRKSAPLPRDEAGARKVGLIETILGALMIVVALS